MDVAWTCHNPIAVDRSRSGVLVLAGVSGCGKTTAAGLLGERLGWSVLDADDLHSASNIKKLTAGTPLTDDDRWPWLERVAEAINGRSGGLAVACSALRQRYRAFLAEQIPGLLFCMLEVSRDTAARRLDRRRGHFMSRSLLASQFADLEPLTPTEHGFSVDGDQDLAAVVTDVIRGLRASSPDSLHGRGGIS